MSVEEAWERVWESLPARWRLTMPSRDIVSGRWSVTAYSRGPGRLTKPQSVTGRGDTEEAALRNLDDHFRGLIPQPEDTYLEELRRRLLRTYN